MTHAQARPGCPCAGHLTHLDTFPDRRLTHDGVIALALSEYRCEQCNRRLLLERIAAADGLSVEMAFTIRADYMPLGPKQAVRALAAKLAHGEGGRPLRS